MMRCGPNAAISKRAAFGLSKAEFRPPLRRMYTVQTDKPVRREAHNPMCAWGPPSEAGPPRPALVRSFRTVSSMDLDTEWAASLAHPGRSKERPMGARRRNSLEPPVYFRAVVGSRPISARIRHKGGILRAGNAPGNFPAPPFALYARKFCST